MVLDSPCHGCTAETGRTPTCHAAGSCQRHDEWKARHEQEREEQRRKREADRRLRSYKCEFAEKAKKLRAHGEKRP